MPTAACVSSAHSWRRRKFWPGQPKRVHWWRVRSCQSTDEECGAVCAVISWWSSFEFFSQVGGFYQTWWLQRDSDSDWEFLLILPAALWVLVSADRLISPAEPGTNRHSGLGQKITSWEVELLKFFQSEFSSDMIGSFKSSQTVRETQNMKAWQRSLQEEVEEEKKRGSSPITTTLYLVLRLQHTCLTLTFLRNLTSYNVRKTLKQRLMKGNDYFYIRQNSITCRTCTKWIIDWRKNPAATFLLNAMI